MDTRCRMKHVIEAGHKSRIDEQTIEMSNVVAFTVLLARRD